MNSSAAASSCPLSLPKTFSPGLSEYRPYPSFTASPPCFRVVCRGGSGYPPHAAVDLKFSLHDALDSTGIDTFNAREARGGFVSQIEKLSEIERGTSICINRRVDLGKTALYIAAEDVSLMSNSPVPLPVDVLSERLHDLSFGYCSHYNSASRKSFLESIDSYLYTKKGFRRNSFENQMEPHALYLHSVLIHRCGSAAMLALIYSEIVKMIRLMGLLDFDVEIFFPHVHNGLPRAYDKQKGGESDLPHVMTTQRLLEKILKNQKEAFWPFKHDRTYRSLFLRAALAANLTDGSNGVVESGYKFASTKFAQHKSKQGVWNNTQFGDMKCALSACERLILLETDPTELRDYSILLYHCGFYKQSLQYLKLYQETKVSSLQKQSLNSVSHLEEDVAAKLMVCLELIAMQDGWRSKDSESSL